MFCQWHVAPQPWSSSGLRRCFRIFSTCPLRCLCILEIGLPICTTCIHKRSFRVMCTLFEWGFGLESLKTSLSTSGLSVVWLSLLLRSGMDLSRHLLLYWRYINQMRVSWMVHDRCMIVHHCRSPSRHFGVGLPSWVQVVASIAPLHHTNGNVPFPIKCSLC